MVLHSALSSFADTSFQDRKFGVVGGQGNEYIQQILYLRNSTVSLVRLRTGFPGIARVFNLGGRDYQLCCQHSNSRYFLSGSTPYVYQDDRHYVCGEDHRDSPGTGTMVIPPFLSTVGVQRRQESLPGEI